MANQAWRTIRVPEEIHAALISIGRGGESRGSILQRLMTHYMACPTAQQERLQYLARLTAQPAHNER